jgi:hypothetical protein
VARPRRGAARRHALHLARRRSPGHGPHGLALRPEPRAGRSLGPSSTRCTSAASHGTRPRRRSTRARSRASSRRSPTCRPGRHRRRAPAGHGLRRAGRAGAGRGGSPQLLGLQHPQLLRAAPGLLRGPARGHAPPRVPRHGQGPAPRRHRRASWTSSSTTPPRAGPGRPGHELQGARQRVFYHLDAADRAATWTTPAAATRSSATTPSCPLHHRLPGVLGARDARRRLPLRPGQRPGPRRPRRADAITRRCSGASS